MNLRKKIVAALTVLAAAAGSAFAGGAFAADPRAVPAVSAPSNYTAVPPVRLLDTRLSVPLSTGGHVVLHVAGQHGVPVAGVTAVALTVTAVNPTEPSYLTVYPDGVTRPVASNLNFTAGETIADQVTVKLGDDGSIALYNHSGVTDVAVDLEGYYTADATVVHAPIAADNVSGAVPLGQVGGAIKTGVTKLTEAVILQPGTYQVTASGVFYRKAGTGAQGDAGVPNTYGTLVIWEDLNNDGVYDWNGTPSENAGTIQTGAIPRMTSDSFGSTIEASANQTSVITVTQPDTRLYLGGFGYNDDTSGYGTAGGPGAGDFAVVPSMTVQKLNVG
ncbi:hypothetical protein [Streptacidiphilus cavernicola]|uniref:VCBS repeat-containing protein n=1 Tax=Streptacidiphilus cavernicola TaxID=3342716 RepID=A0ABV6VXW1_9ACTN